MTSLSDHSSGGEPSSPARATNPGHVAAGRAAARLARAVENALSQVDLSLPQYRTLIFLSEGGAEAASALAGKLGVSRPSVTALVDGLVARSMAERCADPVDRRRVTHTVTRTGLEALERADQIVEDRFAELAKRIPDDDDRSVAYVGLARWLDAMNIERDTTLAGQ